MNKLVRKNKIILDKRQISKIAAEYGCCTVCVYNALAYRSNSKMANDIRNSALKRYGGVSVRIPQVVRT